jgi:Arc/MetJ-type ribon-helix-helix transcriptional regulator
MKPLPESERALKKSVSMTPVLWAFVTRCAGETGNPSKVIQKAVRLLKEQQEKENVKKTDARKKVGESVKSGIREVRECGGETNKFHASKSKPQR